MGVRPSIPKGHMGGVELERRNEPLEKERLSRHKRVLHGELSRILWILGYKPEDATRIVPKMIEAFEEAVSEIVNQENPVWDLVDKYNLGGTD